MLPLNFALLSNPVNWLKVGLMAMTFLLALQFVAQNIIPAPQPNTGN